MKRFDNPDLETLLDDLESDNRTYEQRLASCKMIVSPNETTPTVLGLLSLGKSPQDF
jgi:ATP-dependent DNA helicase RecG